MTLRLLVPATSTEPVQLERLIELYSYPPPGSGCRVRANMVASLDGAAQGDDGLSGSISTAADREVFGVLRGLADVVVAGAGTVRAEGYLRPRRVTGEMAQTRAALRQQPAPCLAVVTGSADLPSRHLPGSSPRQVSPHDPDPERGDLLDRPGRDDDGAWRLLVIAGAGADQDRLERIRDRLGEDCVVTAPEEQVGPHTVLDALRERGLVRVLCEGGPTLLAQFADQDVLDEVCLTVSPVLASGDARRVLSGAPQRRTAMSLSHLIVGGDGTLIGRWVRDASTA